MSLRRGAALSALALVATSLSACAASTQRSCTAIGAASGIAVRVQLKAVRSLDLSIGNDRPQVLTLRGPYTGVEASLKPGDTVGVALVLRDAAGRVLGRPRGTFPVRLVEPNGPECGPHVGRVSLTVTATGALVPN